MILKSFMNVVSKERGLKETGHNRMWSQMNGLKLNGLNCLHTISPNT